MSQGFETKSVDGLQNIRSQGKSKEIADIRQKMKRTAMDNNYMIQVLSCCFIDNILDSSDSLRQA